MKKIALILLSVTLLIASCSKETVVQPSISTTGTDQLYVNDSFYAVDFEAGVFDTVQWTPQLKKINMILVPFNVDSVSVYPQSVDVIGDSVDNLQLTRSHVYINTLKIKTNLQIIGDTLRFTLLSKERYLPGRHVLKISSEVTPGLTNDVTFSMYENSIKFYDRNQLPVGVYNSVVQGSTIKF